MHKIYRYILNLKKPSEWSKYLISKGWKPKPASSYFGLSKGTVIFINPTTGYGYILEEAVLRIMHKNPEEFKIECDKIDNMFDYDDGSWEYPEKEIREHIKDSKQELRNRIFDYGDC